LVPDYEKNGRWRKEFAFPEEYVVTQWKMGRNVEVDIYNPLI
jgi:hypothetical protein